MFKFEAKLSPAARAVTADAELLQILTDGISPVLHLVLPQAVEDNITAIGAVADKNLDRFKIHYAYKANRSKALLVQAKAAGANVDVASLQELQTALSAGYNGTNILGSGPKSADFIRLLVMHGATISIDSSSELNSLIRIIDVLKPSDKIRILLRLNVSGASSISEPSPSRFGLAQGELADAYKLIVSHLDTLDFIGLAFHLDSSSEGDRIKAISYCLDQIKTLASHNLSISVLNIGGGLRQVFSADTEIWNESVISLKRAITEQDFKYVWPGTTFGFSSNTNQLTGTPVFHKYGNTISAPKQLDSLLTALLPSHEVSVAQAINDYGLEVWFELGKSLTDQAGLTVATVDSIKKLESGQTLVGLNLKRDNVVPANQEVMIDPILLPLSLHDHPKAVDAFLSGNLCLERDLITFRTVHFNQTPCPGDLLIFCNTAAYQMDLSATQALGQQVIPKVALYWRDRTNLSKPGWSLDERYEAHRAV